MLCRLGNKILFLSFSSITVNTYLLWTSDCIVNLTISTGLILLLGLITKWLNQTFCYLSKCFYIKLKMSCIPYNNWIEGAVSSGYYCITIEPYCRRWILERKLASSDVPKEEQVNLIKDLERKETEFMRLKRHKICVDDFELLTIIGRGAFGEVRFIF